MVDKQDIIESDSQNEKITIESTVVLKEHSQRKGKWRWLMIIFHQSLCVAWLGPAFTLIILNFREHIVGASLGCFSCHLNPFSSNTFREEAKLNRRDHNALGGLQFASKALEVWFMIVVSGILYDLLVMLTKRNSDFPIGLLARYAQFGDLLSVADYPKGQKKIMHRAFIVLVAALCILVNLMGPATATLLLPTLQWKDKEPRILGVFGTLAADKPPNNVAIAEDCTSAVLAAGNYSCTEIPYSHSLDQLFASVAGSLGQIGQTEIIFDPVISQEQQVSFIVNTTDPDVDWIPSRQVMREMSNDYVRYADGVKEDQPFSNYTVLANSLSTMLLRSGPTVGLAGGCYRGTLSIANITNNKRVRCYGGWNLYAEEGTEYVRCIREGSGWTGTTNTHSRFYIGDTISDLRQNITVDVYFADLVHTPVQLNNRACFADGKPQVEPGCDWDKVFLTEPPTERVRNTSTNVIIVEYTVPDLSSPARAAWCDDIVYQGFQTYTMDPSPFSNFIRLAQLENADPRPDPTTLPLVVHSDWILAGWSVDRNGIVDGTRMAARTIIQLVREALHDTAEALDLSTLNYMDGVAANQGLSMIDYDSMKSGALVGAADKNRPVLQASVRIYVWAYGLSSRTSVLGVVVVIIGIVCVLMRLLVALGGYLIASSKEYATPRTLSKLLLAALEHGPDDRVLEQNVRVKVKGRTVSFHKSP